MVSVSALLLVLATMPPDAIGAQFPEHSLVQADDGTLYVMENGQLHVIVPLPAGPEDLARVPIGSPVTDGVAIIYPPAPVAIAPEAPATQAPATQAPAAGLTMTVLAVERPFRASRNPGSGREWAVIRVRIDNARDRAWNAGAFLSGNPDVFVVDQRGASTQVATLTRDIPEAIRPNVTVPAGGSLEGTLAFEVPVGVPLARVQWMSGGSVLMEAAIP
jgi:hypothetical protein